MLYEVITRGVTGKVLGPEAQLAPITEAAIRARTRETVPALLLYTSTFMRKSPCKR